ncbi:hypothetical protein D3C84_343290 [compost metagenome]
MAGTVLPGPRCCVGPPVGDEVAGLDATLPRTHGGDGADADQVVDQALEFSRGRLYGAIVLGNGGEGEEAPLCNAVSQWRGGLSFQNRRLELIVSVEFASHYFKFFSAFIMKTNVDAVICSMYATR